MQKYSWNFNENSEIWENDAFDTVEDCIEDAKLYASKYEEIQNPEFVFVGENVEFKPFVDAEKILESIEEQASETVWEVAEDWSAYDYKKSDELQELSKLLTKITISWMKEHGYYQEFYTIKRIKKYSLNGEKNERFK